MSIAFEDSSVGMTPSDRRVYGMRLRRTHPETMKGVGTGKSHSTSHRVTQMQMSLSKNSLYVALYLHGFGTESFKFHWALYFHDETHNGGIKYHIRDIGAGWMPEHGHKGGIAKEAFLVGLIEVARNVLEDWHAVLDTLARAGDGVLNATPGITCRTWALDVLSRLIDAGLMENCDLGILEQEILGMGEEWRPSALLAELPRPIRSSRLCERQ